MRSAATISLIFLAVLVSACSSTGGRPAAGASVPSRATGHAGKPRQPVRPPLTQAPPTPRLLQIPGLDGVIGATASDLTRQFGAARLDVWEGDARKLQFTGTPCILDIYLYPMVQGREPQATYVDARRTDGRDVDRAACVTALRKR